AREWPRYGRPRRAGVSSFGISGTNAHVILEEAPDTETVVLESDRTRISPMPWVLSGKTATALAAQAARLCRFVADSDVSAAAVAESLTRRTLFDHRAVVSGSDLLELVAGLESLSAGRPRANVVSGQVLPGRTGVLFSGQGSQRLGMGRELADAFPAFAAALDEVVTELDRWLDRPLREVMWGSDEALLESTRYAQPALFAVEAALFGLLRSWGVTVDAVAGHSVGEITAAHVAGALSLPDAARLVVMRGRLMHELPAGGVMVAIQAEESEITEFLSPEASLAAVNSPTSVVVSGAAGAVESVAAVFAERGRKTSRLRVSHAFHSHSMAPMLERFAAEIAGITVSRARIPVVSNVTGQSVADDWATPGYWREHIVSPVRFSDGVTAMVESGVTRFLELGPGGALTAMVAEHIDPGSAVAAAAMRTSIPEPVAVSAALARVFTRGAEVDWPTVIGGRHAARISLPPYPFQRDRYWLTPARRENATGLGLRDPGHPLLGAVMDSAQEHGVVLSGRLSLAEQPWLADHEVLGQVLFPGTGFVDLALRAGEEVDCHGLSELTLLTPLVLPGDGAVRIQVVVRANEGSREHSVSVYSRAEDAAEWTLHARGLVGEPTELDDPFDWEVWPPAGAEPVDTESAYDVLADLGFGYGPMFRGLRSAWLREGEAFAEVELGKGASGAGFVVHPALLDAAMHTSLLTGGRLVLPFAWSGVRVPARGADRLRVRVVTIGEESRSVQAADEAGRPVLSVVSLAGRVASRDQLVAGGVRDALFGIEWSPVSLPATTTPVRTAAWRAGAEPDPAAELVLLRADGDGRMSPRDRVTGVLAILQAWLADKRFERSRLVVVTRGAVGLPGADVEDLAGAPIWGLVRAAQAEHPGRIFLVDSDSDDPDVSAAAATGEPEMALRDGNAWIPRLTPIATSGTPAPIETDGTILITGGTGGLGAVLARHLVRAHDAKHLLLLSRQGISAPGAEELTAELTAAGASVRIEDCDVADSTRLREILGTIPAHTPLTGVIHTAGVLDAGMIGSLTPERVDATLRAKVHGAWNLHELTANSNLRMFVLFSSVGGQILAGGQGGYAAANAYLDALATHRRAHGRVATALAWGPWADMRMGADITDQQMRRIRRQGVIPLSTTQGLALFDIALAQSNPMLTPVRIDRAALGVRTEELPALLRGLVRTTSRRDTVACPSSAEMFRRLDDPERQDRLLDLALDTAAEVLSYGAGSDLAADSAFQDLGFDSLSAMEFRNKIKSATGLPVPVTAIFDYPTPRDLAKYLTAQFGEGEPAPQAEAAAVPSPGPEFESMDAGELVRRFLEPRPDAMEGVQS
ncbi:type I polyketide synthase, partial [Nocardia sp. NPDC005366]|uniref:type I polyketide synthase n=1 Tax=Nocardia sp. NPDC005366 TaxID=3156878 RepID=UPI0033BBA9D5